MSEQQVLAIYGVVAVVVFVVGSAVSHEYILRMDEGCFDLIFAMTVLSAAWPFVLVACVAFGVLLSIPYSIAWLTDKACKSIKRDTHN